MTAQANVYGQAFYTLAKDENCDRQILEELSVLDESFATEPEYLRLLSAPNLSKEERIRILDTAFRGKVHPYVLNFMKLLTEKGYIRQFPDCFRVFREEFDRDHGILEVKAVTAVALSDAQREKLSAKLASVTGKTVRLLEQVDPQLLGGVRLDYDGRRVDDTVANRLASIGALLKNTVL
jgi:F-type H+-transporting ATPase subunit delta